MSNLVPTPVSVGLVRLSVDSIDLILPPLVTSIKKKLQIKYHGTKTKKNHIIHFIKGKSKVIGEADSIERTSFILRHQNDIEYFITSNKKNIPEDKSHVVTCNSPHKHVRNRFNHKLSISTELIKSFS